MNILNCLYYSVCDDRGCYCPLADHTSIDKKVYNDMVNAIEEEAAYWKEQSFEDDYDEYYDEDNYTPLYKEEDDEEDYE